MVLHIMQIMEFVITYVKFCLLMYYPVVNVALRTMPICNLYHDADLVRMVVLTLNFILWLKGVVRMVVLTLNFILWLYILLGFLVERHQKITYMIPVSMKLGSY